MGNSDDIVYDALFKVFFYNMIGGKQVDGSSDNKPWSPAKPVESQVQSTK